MKKTNTSKNRQKQQLTTTDTPDRTVNWHYQPGDLCVSISLFPLIWTKWIRSKLAVPFFSTYVHQKMYTRMFSITQNNLKLDTAQIFLNTKMDMLIHTEHKNESKLSAPWVSLKTLMLTKQKKRQKHSAFQLYTIQTDTTSMYVMSQVYILLSTF